MSNYSHKQDNSHSGSRRTPSGERGRRRRDLILDTAARVLADEGRDALTTNALAERAGIAIGSVYQYFSNIEAVTLALGQRFLDRLEENTVAALSQDLSGLSIPEMVDRVIDPMIEFERKHPAFSVLAEDVEQVDARILQATLLLLDRVRPNLDRHSARRAAHVAKATYKSISYLIRHEERLETGVSPNALLADIKEMLAGYLARVLGE